MYEQFGYRYNLNFPEEENVSDEVPCTIISETPISEGEELWLTFGIGPGSKRTKWTVERIIRIADQLPKENFFISQTPCLILKKLSD